MTERRKHELAELITKTWSLIDYIEKRLKASTLENDKIRWAGVLASTIGTLNKLFYKAGIGKFDKDDMAILLSKIPKKFRQIVRRRIEKIGRQRSKSRKRF